MITSLTFLPILEHGLPIVVLCFSASSSFCCCYYYYSADTMTTTAAALVLVVHFRDCDLDLAHLVLVLDLVLVSVILPRWEEK